MFFEGEEEFTSSMMTVKKALLLINVGIWFS